MSELPLLERNILRAKGMTEQQIAALPAAGITGKSDFATVGDTKTLCQITGLDESTALAVMTWATGLRMRSSPAAHDNTAVVYCVHCQSRQPKDYWPGDLCTSCGRQAEPVLVCHWCGASGPGRFCRQCGAQHVLAGDLELAIQLRRDGVAKDDIPSRLAGMLAPEREALLARAHKALQGHVRNL